MNLPRKYAAVLIAASAGAAALAFSLRAQQSGAGGAAQPTAAAAPVSTLIVLDPAHGGSDTGSLFGGSESEKDVTLAFASRIRGALTSSGFTVISTRDADPTASLTTDQRAETANRLHPLACIVLHASATGSGVHVYTSGLPSPAPDEATPDSFAPFVPVPWEFAQSGFVTQSRSLATELTSVLGSDHLPAISGHAAVRPLENLMCPAIAIELAPLLTANSSVTSPADSAYQQQVATTLTNVLRTWRDQSHPTASASVPNLDSQIAAQSRAIAAAEAAGRAATQARAASAQPAPSQPTKGQP